MKPSKRPWQHGVRFAMLGPPLETIMRIAQPQEGFLSKGRIVYSVLYSLQSAPPKIQQLIVTLDRHGNAINGLARPVDRSKRIVQVCPGEQIRFREQTFTVTAVEAYRWSKMK